MNKRIIIFIQNVSQANNLEANVWTRLLRNLTKQSENYVNVSTRSTRKRTIMAEVSYYI